ncbi:MAG: bifunctional sugar-1-phosphate nucleotidylyltransferase/acetyltransferase, partial [Thermoplasmatota archaeon]
EATLKRLVHEDGFAVAAATVPDASQYGALEVEDGRVTGIHEKSPNPPSDLVNTGMYRVPADVLQATGDLHPSPRGELEFTDLLPGAAVVPASGWFDIGTPWQYLSAHEAMLDEPAEGVIHGEGVVEDGVILRGTLHVEAGAVVKSGTYIEGTVHIAAGAVVGPNAYLRGPVQIGRECKVGAFCEIKNSILLAGAKAPHHNYVGDSVLGHACNLGSGTKLANVKHTPKTIRVDWDGQLVDTGRRKFGSVIGDHAKTGINASLNPGTVLGVGALVGAGASVHGWIGPGERRL